jgi:hypothetical protein
VSLSITMFSIKGLFVKLSTTALCSECHYDRWCNDTECGILFIYCCAECFGVYNDLLLLVLLVPVGDGLGQFFQLPAVVELNL